MSDPISFCENKMQTVDSFVIEMVFILNRGNGCALSDPVFHDIRIKAKWKLEDGLLIGGKFQTVHIIYRTICLNGISWTTIDLNEFNFMLFVLVAISF